MKVKSEMKHWKGWNIANKSTRSKSFSQGMPGGMSFTPIDTSKSWSYQCCLIESCFPRLHVHRCWRAFHTRMWKDEVLCVPLGYAGFYGSEKQTEGKMFFMRFAGCGLVGSSGMWRIFSITSKLIISMLINWFSFPFQKKKFNHNVF